MRHGMTMSHQAPEPSVWSVRPGKKTTSKFLRKAQQVVLQTAAAIAVIAVTPQASAETRPIVFTETAAAKATTLDRNTPSPNGVRIVVATSRDDISAIGTLFLRTMQDERKLSVRERSIAQWLTEQRLLSALKGQPTGYPLATIFTIDWPLVKAMAQQSPEVLTAFQRGVAQAQTFGGITEEAVQAAYRIRQARESMIAEQSTSTEEKATVACIVVGPDIADWWRRHHRTIVQEASPVWSDIVRNIAERTIILFSDEEIGRIVWAHEYGHCLDDEIVAAHRRNGLEIDDPQSIRWREERADLFAFVRSIRGMTEEQAIRIGRHMVWWRAADTVLFALQGKPFDSLTHRTETALHVFLEDMLRKPEALRRLAAETPSRIMESIAAWLSANRERIDAFGERYRKAYDTVAALSSEGPQTLSRKLTQEPRDAAESMVFGILRPAFASAEATARATLRPFDAMKSTMSAEEDPSEQTEQIPVRTRFRPR